MSYLSIHSIVTIYYKNRIVAIVFNPRVEIAHVIAKNSTWLTGLSSTLWLKVLHCGAGLY
jgi:hypothetical protein